MVDTKGCDWSQYDTGMEQCTNSAETHNLKLNGHDSEVDHLHSWPDEVVRLERRHIDVLELLLHGLSAAALCHRHVSEEDRKTYPRMSATNLFSNLLPIWICAYR